MKYRSEIDGLRAVAVVPVILFHAGLSVLPGGFVGVDVFFVISGYLITTILIEDRRKGSYSVTYLSPLDTAHRFPLSHPAIGLRRSGAIFKSGFPGEIQV